jgi:hypothetical protein
MARVHRTYWIVRQRYRRFGYLASLVSLVLCALWLVPNVHGAEGSAAVAAPLDLPSTIAVILLAALIPSVIARLCWRLHRRRYFADIYPLGVV